MPLIKPLFRQPQAHILTDTWHAYIRCCISYFILLIDALFFIFALPFFFLFLLNMLTAFISGNNDIFGVIINDYLYFHDVAENISHIFHINIIMLAIGVKFFLEIIDFLVVGFFDKKFSFHHLISQSLGDDMMRKVLKFSGFAGIAFFLILLMSLNAPQEMLSADLLAIHTILSSSGHH